MSSAPDEVRAWAQARSEARATRDWPEADRLRTAIEAAGWRVIDRGTRFSLEPAHPPDVVDGDRIRHGSSASVPSRLDAPTAGSVSVLMMATDQPGDLARALAALGRHAIEGTQVVIVADGSSPEQEAELMDPAGPAGRAIRGLIPEVVWTSERLGAAGALNSGLRRTSAPVVVLLDTAVEPTGDLLGPLVRALGDPTIAVAGPWGYVSDDLRRFEPGPPGDVDTIDGAALAFRRSDVLERGFLDERFRLALNLDIWWSLVLRDGGEDRSARRAVALADLPVVRHERAPDAGADSRVDAAERERQVRRSFYRVLDRFGARRDLLVGKASAPA